MPPIPPEYKIWLDLLQWLVTGLIAATVWLRKPGEDAGEAVSLLRKELSKQLSGLIHRLIVVEERIKHSPSSEELAELEGTVKTISAQLLSQSESNAVMRAQLTRIESYLLNRKES